MPDYFRSLYSARFILRSLVYQDFKNKYRNSLLGFGWSLLTPLGLVMIIGGVFSQVMRQNMAEFIPYLFSGLIPWFYIAQSAEGGSHAFISAEGYIKQTQTPVVIFPIRVALGALIQLVISIVAFLIISVLINSAVLTFHTLFLLLALPLWMILGVALATISAVINTYIRDFMHVQTLLLQALFYATPIIFPAKLLNGTNFMWLYEWNPYYYVIEIIRNPLQGLPVKSGADWTVAISFIMIVFVAAVILIQATGRKITFRL